MALSPDLAPGTETNAADKRAEELALLRVGDEASIARLDKLEPGFKMEYPLSNMEKIAFSNFEQYINGIMFPGNSLLDTWDPEVLNALDQEKERRLRGEPELRSHWIGGFKIKRWERWELEEQVRQEREALEAKSELSKAA